MIGLDAAELSFIQHHLPALPALRRVLEAGTLCPLASTAGVFPGSVWPTFYSGRLPGDHGIYHHLQWDPDAMQLRRVTEDWLYAEPFWYELERRGFRVAAIDVPMSFPSRLTRGVEVINWGSHDELGSFRAYPGQLPGEIRRRFGRHPMGSEIPVRKSREALEKIRSNLVAGARLKGELSLWVLSQAEWDFYLTVFGETHRGGHLLWPDEGLDGSGPRDGLLEIYQAVDQSIGRLIDGLPEDTTVIVFALHGMGPNGSQEHFMPKVIDRVNAGFLRARQASDLTGSDATLDGQRSAMRALREHLPAGLQNVIARAVPVAIRDMVVSRQICAGHDWSRTPGIALLADLNGYLRWNTRGREHRGMLKSESEELKRYVEWVRYCLAGLKVHGATTGIVGQVLLVREHMSGSRVNRLPDAVVTWNGLPPVTRIHSDEIGTVAAVPATGRAGNHRSDGFCIVLDGTPGGARHLRPPRHICELKTYVSELMGSRAEEHQ